MEQITSQEALTRAINATGKTVAQIQSDYLYPQPLSTTGLFSDYAIQKYINTRLSITLSVEETATFINETEQRVYQLIRGGYLKTVEQNKPRSGIYVYSAQEYVRNRDTLKYNRGVTRADISKAWKDYINEILAKHQDKVFSFLTLTLKKVESRSEEIYFITESEVPKSLEKTANGLLYQNKEGRILTLKKLLDEDNEAVFYITKAEAEEYSLKKATTKNETPYYILEHEGGRFPLWLGKGVNNTLYFKKWEKSGDEYVLRRKKAKRKNGCFVFINEDEVKKYLKAFLNKLDRLVYGQKAKKQAGPKLVRLCSIEKDFVGRQKIRNVNERYHIHMFLEVPLKYVEDVRQYKNILREIYEKMNWSYHELDFQMVDGTPEKLLDYIIKEEKKLNGTSVEWDSTYF